MSAIDLITMDFETRGVVDLIKCGATRYALDPYTQVLVLCWSYGDEFESFQDPIHGLVNRLKVHTWNRAHTDKGVQWCEKSPRPDELIERIRKGALVEAHNAGFEYRIWNHVLMREFLEFDVPLQVEQMRCSAAKASCMSLRRKLGDAANDLGISERKDTDGTRLINLLSKPRKSRRKDAISTEIEWCETEIEHRRNWDYCAQDVRTEHALSKAVPDMMPREIDYWLMDFRMNLRGVALDEPAVDHALALCRAQVETLNAEMLELTDGEVDSASKRAKFMAWVNKQIDTLRTNGHKVAYLEDTQANTISMRLYGVPTKASDEARIAATERREKGWASTGAVGAKIRRAFEIAMEVNKSSVAKFRRMKTSVCNGRLHDIMLYNGADRTGRWSGQGVQPHNFVRGYSKQMGKVWDLLWAQDWTTIEIMYGDKPLPALAKACRGALVASLGKEIYAADFSAIEARVLAWFANCKSMLELFRTGGDPYCALATLIYKRTITKADETERQLGKAAVLGLGYAMGWEKFQTTVFLTTGVWLDDDFCKEVVRVYRFEACPEMPVLWKAVENAAISAVKGTPGREWHAGGDEDGNGRLTYFMRGRFLHCRLPSGRLLAYLDPQVKTVLDYRFKAFDRNGKEKIIRVMAIPGTSVFQVRHEAENVAKKRSLELDEKANQELDCNTSERLSFMGRHIATKQWTRIYTFGGSLVENADQAASRDLLAESMYRVDSMPDFDLLLSIHDEVIAEAPIGSMMPYVTDAILEKCKNKETGVPDMRLAELKAFEGVMSEVPQWATGMPINAEGWIGPRLRK